MLLELLLTKLWPELILTEVLLIELCLTEFFKKEILLTELLLTWIVFIYSIVKVTVNNGIVINKTVVKIIVVNGIVVYGTVFNKIFNHTPPSLLEKIHLFLITGFFCINQCWNKRTKRIAFRIFSFTSKMELEPV